MMGASRRGSIRQPPSHNYTSASSRLIHHMDTHDYISPALGLSSIYTKKVAGTCRPISQPLFEPLCMTFISTVCKSEWKHVPPPPVCGRVCMTVRLLVDGTRAEAPLSSSAGFLVNTADTFPSDFPFPIPERHLFHPSIL